MYVMIYIYTQVYTNILSNNTLSKTHFIKSVLFLKQLEMLETHYVFINIPYR